MIKVKRHDSADDTNAGYDIIAAIKTPNDTNGFPEYIVTGWHSEDKYVTWRMTWYPVTIKDTENKTIQTWNKNYSSGRYFETDDNGVSARDRAFLNMVERATGKNADYRRRTDEIGSAELLAMWEIQLVWPRKTRNGDNIADVPESLKQSIYDNLRTHHKITAIKDYRTYTGDKLIFAKEAVDQIAAILCNDIYNELGHDMHDGCPEYGVNGQHSVYCRAS